MHGPQMRKWQEGYWTAEKVEALRELWTAGHSGQVIAQLLGDGITRNAVIGKAHRLCLERRVERQGIRPARYPTRRRKRVLTPRPPFPPQVPKPPPPPPRPRRLTLFELESNSCRWPIELDNPKTFWGPTTHFCGDSKQDGFPYCERHVLKAYPKRGTR